MHISLIHLIPNKLRYDIDEQFSHIIQFTPNLRYTLWPQVTKYVRFQLRDNPQREFITQAIYQYLAHHHCVISTCLIGYSFSYINHSNSQVTSNTAAYWYLKSGISMVYHNQSMEKMDWLLVKNQKLWSDICRAFLCHEYRHYKSEDDVVVFAEKFVTFYDKKTA
jgi:hypothetical protein